MTFMTKKRRRWGFCFEWKLADMWVGVFWKRRPNRAAWQPGRLDIWICVIPCVPLHVWRLGQ